MTPALDVVAPDAHGCRHRHSDEGHGHGHRVGGRGCGGRRRHEEVELSLEEEIAVLEQQIAESKAQLDELRRS